MAKRKSKARNDYAVGYAKPPKHTQFRKGQSGNPKGRPKGSKNAATLLTQVLAEKVTIRENGQHRQVSKLEATFKQVVNRAASGDDKASRLLMQMIPLLDAGLPEAPPALLNTEADLKVIAEIAARAMDHHRNDDDEEPSK